MSQNKDFDHIFFLLNNNQRRCITIFKKFSQLLRRGAELNVTKILKSCAHHNRWFTSYSMTFSVIYVTADTLQVKPRPVYVTLRNPINWLRGSRTCIDDDQPGLRNHECGMYTGWFMVVPAPLPLRPQSMRPQSIRPQTHAAPIPIRPLTYPAPGRSGPILLNIKFAPPFTSHVPCGPTIVVPVGRSGPTFL